VRYLTKYPGHGISESGQSPSGIVMKVLIVSSALGLSSLFAMTDPGLRTIIVKGDLIINEANRDSTSIASSLAGTN
jgi:hypothetical protein